MDSRHAVAGVDVCAVHTAIELSIEEDNDNRSQSQRRHTLLTKIDLTQIAVDGLIHQRPIGGSIRCRDGFAALLHERRTPIQLIHLTDDCVAVADAGATAGACVTALREHRMP